MYATSPSRNVTLPAIPTRQAPALPEENARRDEPWCKWLTDYKNGNYGPAGAPLPPVVEGPRDAGEGKTLPPNLFKTYPSLRELDGILRIENYDDPDVKRSVEDLARYPAPLLRRLRQAGLKEVHFAARPAAKLGPNSVFADVQTRGWPAGQTYSDAAGAYNPEAKYLAIGKGSSGSASTAIHETGHAIGYLLGFNDDPRVKAHHDRLFMRANVHPCYPSQLLPKLDAYYRQTTPEGDRAVGRDEFFAESLAVYLAQGRHEAIKRYDETYVKFLEKDVLGVRPAPFRASA